MCCILKVSGGGLFFSSNPCMPEVNYQIFLDKELVESGTNLAVGNRLTPLGACDGPEEIGDPLECEEGSELLRVEVQIFYPPGRMTPGLFIPVMTRKLSLWVGLILQQVSKRPW
jgi:hypothetical protein